MTSVTFRVFFLALLFLGVAAALPALAKKETKTDVEQENVTLNTGIIAMEENPYCIILPIAMGAQICGVFTTAIATGVFVATMGLMG